MYMIKIENEVWKTHKLNDIAVDIVMYFIRHGKKEMPKIKRIAYNGRNIPSAIENYQAQLDLTFFQIKIAEGK